MQPLRMMALCLMTIGILMGTWTCQAAYSDPDQSLPNGPDPNRITNLVVAVRRGLVVAHRAAHAAGSAGKQITLYCEDGHQVALMRPSGEAPPYRYTCPKCKKTVRF